MGLLDIPLVARTRRHHALEHATIHILNKRYPALRLIGRSTPSGFYLYGHIPTAEVQRAVREALTRLRRGESHLAIHPRCGTNLVTAGILVGLTTYLTMLPGDRRSQRERLPLVVLLSTLTLMLAQPLGLRVQEHITTDAHPAAELTARVQPGQRGKTPVHRITLAHGA